MDVVPVRIGPTAIPAHTLGWEVLDWCSSHLTNLDGNPWVFTSEQARFVLSWYAIDENGNWDYRRGVLRRMKGWGKDPLAAVMAACEWIGPCRFGGWYRDGRPRVVREPASWIQVAAATAQQAEQNTMSLLPVLIPKWLEVEERLSLGQTICWGSGKRRIQSVSNSSRGLEGARPTFVIEGETQHWVRSNGGIRLAEVIRRNLAKAPAGNARGLAVTNAHMAGEASVAELDWLSRESADILYDSVEAPPGLDLSDDDQVMAGVLAARGDSVWIDVRRILREFREPSADEGLNRRYFHNQIVAGSGRWMDPSTWAAAELPGMPPEDGRPITLGFDGSINRDATALVGTDIESGWQWIIGVWEKEHSDPNWSVDIAEVHRVVDEARTRWTVTRFYADPSWWEESLANWSASFTRPDGKSVVAAWYATNKLRMARSLQAYHQSVVNGGCTHERSWIFDRHVIAAHKEPLKGRAGEDGLVTIQKASRSSTDCIDAAMAAALSWQACLDSRGDGDLALGQETPLRVHLPPWLS